MSLTLEDLNQRLQDISDQCNAILAGISISGTQVIITEGLSDISQNLGMISAGEFRCGVGTPGWNFTGMRMGSPGWTVSGTRYALLGYNNNVTQVGISAETGKLFVGAGTIEMSADGIVLEAINDGASWTTDGNKIAFRYNGVVEGGISYAIYDIPTSTHELFMELNCSDTTPEISINSNYSGSSPFIYPKVVLAANSPDVSGHYSNISILGGTSSGITLTSTGDITVQSDFIFEDSLISKKGGVEYDVYGFHPLQSPLTSTSWDGDSFSTTSKTLLDLSSVFSAPAGIKAIVVRVAIQDSGAAGTDCYLILGPTNDAAVGIPFACFPSNDRWNRVGGIVVPCDANGDVYYQIAASGSGTLDINLQIWGYYI